MDYSGYIRIIRGRGQTRQLPKQNFFSAGRVQKKFRRRSESQPRFFGGDDSRVTKTEISICVLRQTKQKRIHTIDKMMNIWVMVIKQTDTNSQNFVNRYENL